MDATEIRTRLAHHTGSTSFTRHARSLLLTKGVVDMAEQCRAWCLVDVVASYQRQLADEEFQLWALAVADDNMAVVSYSGRAQEQEPHLVGDPV